MPTSSIQTSQHFEWEASWSVGLLALGCLLFAGWSLYHILREGRIAGTRWSALFLLLRLVVAGVLLWMLLGPSTVLVRKESHPKTLAVFLDNSSSMQIQDQPDAIADRRWALAATEDSSPSIAADKAMLYSSAMRQEVTRLGDLIDQQGAIGEREESVARWRDLAGKCRPLLDEPLAGALSSEQQVLLRELSSALSDELLPLLPSADSTSGEDSVDLEERLRRLTELGDQFAVRCRILADSLSTPGGGADSTLTTTGSEGTPTRLSQAIPAMSHALENWLREGKDKFRIHLAQFSDTVAPVRLEGWEASLAEANLPPNGASPVVRRTDLAELLKQIRDESGKEEYAAAVIVSDGRQSVESAEDPRDLAAQLRVPLYLVPIGRGQMKRDLILHHLHAPPSVIEGDKILIEGIMTAHRCAGEGCEIQLREGDSVLESRQITFKNIQEDQRFRFEVPTDRPGRREFRLSVPQLADEHSSDNNVGALGVDVADAVLRLLVADGRARWEHQYLVNLFRRQERIEFDQLTFAPRPTGTGRREATHQFPETVEEWSHYRVVILGDVGPRQIGRASQEALREHVVRRGGCVIVIAGQNDMPQAFQGEPLESLLPVEVNGNFALAKSGYRVDMTVDGRTADVMQLADDLASTEAIWREMSSSLPIYFLSSFHKARPTSRVWLNALPINAAEGAGASPAVFLAWQQVGAGRVVYLSSPSTYQLRMRNGDKFHNRFWGQLIRWIASGAALTGSKSVRLMADKSNYNAGDTAQLTVELTDGEGRPVPSAESIVDVLKGTDLLSNVPLAPDPNVPGRYQGRFSVDEAGRYTVRVRGAEVERLLAAEKYVDPVQVEVVFEPGLDRELLDPRSDRPLLEHLAEKTGGLVLEPTALAELSRALPLEPRTQESSQRTPLWDRWWCLWVILGCLSLEWIIRKQIGLA